jgi:Ser/Thr protein kinase RdoA (MazF antagonist)
MRHRSAPQRDGLELRRELEWALAGYFDRERGIVELAQRPNLYRSSFAIHDVSVTFDDGSDLNVVLKDLSWLTIKRRHRGTKPPFLRDPKREIEMYTSVLNPTGLGTAACYGSVAQPARDRFWLFLERVDGLRLAETGEFSTWLAVARWLARLHQRFSTVLPSLSDRSTARLVRYDGDYFRLWRQRAQAALPRAVLERSLKRSFRHLLSRYDIVIDRLVALPPTIVHGEFYAENVLVDGGEGNLRVCPVDWEMAALAPGVIDLAGLVAGSWTEAQRRALAASYHTERNGTSGPLEDFLFDLACSRIHVALQWIGWPEAGSRRWDERPRMRNWLRDALIAAEELAV